MPISVIRFDQRAPAFSPATPRELYAAALDMAAFADERGFQIATLSEHHGVEDGYLPSPLVMAGAIVGRTKRISVNFSALLVPLYDPVKLAEDLAVLDLASGGRIMVVAGLGYRPEEYEALGRDWSRRGKLLDESLEVLLRAWTGEPFEYQGRRVRVTPVPHTKPHPSLFVGGSTPAAARRAARFGLPFAPPLTDPELTALYQSECERLGVKGGFVLAPGAPATTFVAKDPERAWQQLGRHMLHDAVTYAAWQRPEQRSYQHSRATTVAALRAEGKYRILTPDECVEVARREGPFSTFVHAPLCGGAPPELGFESLALYADEVLPRIAPPAQ
jgi:alkanesulfonate monooxygenase SsuD/methylene tetrahydromethanopterin reductase-like flavin-dependent oxidoreductase (luciferase family)